MPDQKLDAFVAANPELKLDAAAIRAGEKATVPADQAIKDKLLTAEEAAGATDVTVYNIPGGGAFAMFADPAAGQLADDDRASCSSWSSS